MTEYLIEAFWDPAAAVWVATSGDCPGLATEADTVEALLAKLRVIIPELLDCAGQPVTGAIPFHLHTRRQDIARAS